MIFDPQKVICVTSNARQNFSLSYGDTRDALSNRKNFLKSLGVDYCHIVCAGQTHSDNIRLVTEEDQGRGALDYAGSIPDTDAFVTDVRRLPLAIFTADCIPVFLYDPKAQAIGLAHAGWKGVLKGIAPKTVSKLQSFFNVEPKNIYAGFGPSIRSCCCQVGEEFKESVSYGLLSRNGAYYLDLISIAKKQLLDAGLREENISDSQECTCCRKDEYFSFRREKEGAGRMISVLMLK